MKWQILIATIQDRHDQFVALKSELERQISLLENPNDVEILFDLDNREKSIGKKRQDLLERSTAEYINYIDDDDFPSPHYVKNIYQSLLTGCDCVGMIIKMTTDGKKPQTCCHSLRYRKWDDKRDGFDYVRNVTHFNPVKRSLAVKVGFSDVRWGEDKVYSDKLTTLCKQECFVDEPLFHYRYTTHIPFKKKYGIK